MDFPAAWKASSIVLTGAFGVLGLLKDFKDKQTQKITRWGYISLAGILVSTVFGVAAQLKENSDDSAKALALARKSDATLQKEDITLRQLQRLLSPSVGSPTITLSLEAPCENDRYKSFCDAARSVAPALSSARRAGLAELWPPNQNQSLEIMATVFKDPSAARSYTENAGLERGDLRFDLDWKADKHRTADDRVLIGTPPHQNDILYIAQIPSEAPDDASGKIFSSLDLYGASVVIEFLSHPELKPTAIGFSFPNGQQVFCGPISAERNKYWCELPSSS